MRYKRTGICFFLGKCIFQILRHVVIHVSPTAVRLPQKPCLISSPHSTRVLFCFVLFSQIPKFYTKPTLLTAAENSRTSQLLYHRCFVYDQCWPTVTSTPSTPPHPSRPAKIRNLSLRLELAQHFLCLCFMTLEGALWTTSVIFYGQTYR